MTDRYQAMRDALANPEITPGWYTPADDIASGPDMVLIAAASPDVLRELLAEHDQRVTLQHHAADLAQRVADLEAEVARITECGRAHIRRAADFEAERNTARGAVRELERQVFALQQQRDVLQTCLDRHQRDAEDPPGYLQDAVIRAAGLGALHEERDAAIRKLRMIEAATFPDWLTAALRHQGAASLQRLCNDAGHHVDYSVVAAWLESIGWCEADITAM